jgi:TetR/AcrR family transcriptional regulator, ethionamide resistance regulator
MKVHPSTAGPIRGGGIPGVPHPLEDDKNGVRRDARRRKITQRLLPTLEELLQRDDGFQAITVEQILSASGLSRTTFYRYFTDKTDLLIALAEPMLEITLEGAVRPFEQSGAVTIGDLEREVGKTMSLYMHHVRLLRAMVEVATYDSRVRTKFRGVFDVVHQYLARRFEEGQRAGFVRPDILPWETAGWITWMGERGMSQLAATASDDERERLSQSLARLVWHGVYIAGE